MFFLLSLFQDDGLPPGWTFEAPGRNKIAWYQSPNYRARPGVDTIVLHHTAGSTLHRSGVEIVP